MAGYTSGEVVHHYARLEGMARGIAHSYADLHQRRERARRNLILEWKRAAVELARAYLPSLEADDLERAERLTGFRGFSRRDPHKAMAHELGVLEATVRRIQADARFQRRELLIGPRGDLILEKEEAEEHLAHLDGQCRLYEDHEGFLELIETRYDTPDFDVAFWEGRYWKLWATGDRITAALGKDDFGDEVLPAYLELARQRDQWRAFLREAEQKIADVREFVRQHDQSLARMPRLGEIYLEGCWTMLGEFLRAADLPLLEQWLAKDGEEGDRAIVMALRKVAGTHAKLLFLDDLGDGIEALVRDLHERAGKYQRKQAKFRRPKHAYRRYGVEVLDQKFSDKHEKLRARGAQIVAALDRLVAYDDYDQFPLDNDPDLWWREMTGSRPPRLMRDTRSYYDRHPQARPRREARRRAREERAQEERAQREAAARAAASHELDDAGYFS